MFGSDEITTQLPCVLFDIVSWEMARPMVEQHYRILKAFPYATRPANSIGSFKSGKEREHAVDA